MILDGYGDQMPADDDSAIIAAYERWLHKVANDYLMPWDERHDDLVQEGRIAMWRALAKYDPAAGSLPSWLTTAAKMRMKTLAFGKGQPTGHEAVRGVRDVDVAASLDALIEEDGAEGLLEAADALVEVEMAYHAGEIAEALNSLSPAQKRYVLARFWCGLDPTSRAPAMRDLITLVPEVSKRHLWSGSARQVGARDRLAERLAHLVGAV